MIVATRFSEDGARPDTKTIQHVCWKTARRNGWVDGSSWAGRLGGSFVWPGSHEVYCRHTNHRFSVEASSNSMKHRHFPLKNPHFEMKLTCRPQSPSWSPQFEIVKRNSTIGIIVRNFLFSVYCVPVPRPIEQISQRNGRPKAAHNMFNKASQNCVQKCRKCGQQWSEIASESVENAAEIAPPSSCSQNVSRSYFSL